MAVESSKANQGLGFGTPHEPKQYRPIGGQSGIRGRSQRPIRNEPVSTLDSRHALLRNQATDGQSGAPIPNRFLNQEIGQRRRSLILAQRPPMSSSETRVEPRRQRTPQKRMKLESTETSEESRRRREFGPIAAGDVRPAGQSRPITAPVTGSSFQDSLETPLERLFVAISASFLLSDGCVLAFVGTQRTFLSWKTWFS